MGSHLLQAGAAVVVHAQLSAVLSEQLVQVLGRDRRSCLVDDRRQIGRRQEQHLTRKS